MTDTTSEENKEIEKKLHDEILTYLNWVQPVLRCCKIRADIEGVDFIDFSRMSENIVILQVPRPIKPFIKKIRVKAADYEVIFRQSELKTL